MAVDGDSGNALVCEGGGMPCSQVCEQGQVACYVKYTQRPGHLKLSFWAVYLGVSA